MMRTHYCGSLTEAQIDQTVTLCGWVHRRRDHGGVIFLDMRDRDGLVQVVIDPDTPEAFATADKSRSEFVLKITGRVRRRYAGTENANITSGQIEVLGKEIVVGTVINIPKLKLPIRTLKASDLLINVNFSFRDNSTVIRKVVENTNQATAGQTTVSFKLDANYKLSEHLSAIFYYEQFLNTPKVFISYPTGNLKTGITLRFDLNGLK